MSETKWTPGPWTRCDANRDPEDIGVGNGEWVVADVCADCSVTRGEGEPEANAHLIAASPKMADYIKRKADDGCTEAQQIWTEITNAEG